MVARALLNDLGAPVPDTFDFGKRVSWTKTGLLTAILKHATDLALAEIRRHQIERLTCAWACNGFQICNGWRRRLVEKATQAPVAP